MLVVIIGPLLTAVLALAVQAFYRRFHLRPADVGFDFLRMAPTMTVSLLWAAIIFIACTLILTSINGAMCVLISHWRRAYSWRVAFPALVVLVVLASRIVDQLFAVVIDTWIDIPSTSLVGSAVAFSIVILGMPILWSIYYLGHLELRESVQFFSISLWSMSCLQLVAFAAGTALALSRWPGEGFSYVEVKQPGGRLWLVLIPAGLATLANGVISGAGEWSKKPMAEEMLRPARFWTAGAFLVFFAVVMAGVGARAGARVEDGWEPGMYPLSTAIFHSAECNTFEWLGPRGQPRPWPELEGKGLVYLGEVGTEPVVLILYDPRQEQVLRLPLSEVALRRVNWQDCHQPI